MFKDIIRDSIDDIFKHSLWIDIFCLISLWAIWCAVWIFIGMLFNTFISGVYCGIIIGVGAQYIFNKWFKYTFPDFSDKEDEI